MIRTTLETHRRRTVAALAVAALAVIALAAGCAGPPRLTASGVDVVEIVTHTVAEGEDLESIADDYYGTRRAAVYLGDVNDVPDGVTLPVGAALDVPVGDEDVERYRRRTEAKAIYNFGTILAENGELMKAAEQFKEALRIDPRFADAGYNLGVVLLMLDQSEGAVAILSQVVAVRPDDAEAEFAFGKALFDSGRHKEAIGAFGRALELDAGHEEAAYARALALSRVGRRDEAVFALDAYLRAHPDGAWAPQARLRLEELARD